MQRFIRTLLLCFLAINTGFSQTDNDGDGYYDDVDCNDADGTINPGVYEDYCNNDGIDNNCNGQTDENYDFIACNGGGGPYDNDGDGYYDNVDCNDADGSINPGVYEDYCNNDGIDNNCNGSIDENYDNYMCNGGAYDNDGDGYNEIDDCNDWDGSVNPGIYEDQCNNDGIDNNCNGQTDENYNYNVCNGIYDNDGDGYYNDSDCDDSNFELNPGAVEVCDGVDNNCNGSADEGLPTTVYYIDNDGDGYGNGSAGDFCSDPGINYSLSNEDCDDDNSAIYPGAPEIMLNGIDEDCNGADQLAGLSILPVSGFQLYPNPGSAHLRINLSEQENGVWTVTLFDNQGKRVAFQQSATETGTIEVNTLSLDKGIYQVVIANNKRLYRTSWIKI